MRFFFVLSALLFSFSASAEECSEAQIKRGCSTIVRMQGNTCGAIYYNWGVQRLGKCMLNKDGETAEREFSCQGKRWDKSRVIFGWQNVGEPALIKATPQDYLREKNALHAKLCKSLEHELSESECESHVKVDCDEVE